MAVHLICEVACNPQIRGVDALIGSKDRVTLVARQRTLRYTPHVLTSSGDFGFCQVCGVGRNYGGQPRVLSRPTYGGVGGR